MKPSDYYFHVALMDGMTIATICPITFFEDYHYLDDSGDDEKVMRPYDNFYIHTEAQYETEMSVEEARAFLLKAGFKESQKFSDYLMRV